MNIPQTTGYKRFAVHVWGVNVLGWSIILYAGGLKHTNLFISPTDNFYMNILTGLGKHLAGIDIIEGANVNRANKFVPFYKGFFGEEFSLAKTYCDEAARLAFRYWGIGALALAGYSLVMGVFPDAANIGAVVGFGLSDFHLTLDAHLSGHIPHQSEETKDGLTKLVDEFNQGGISSI